MATELDPVVNNWYRDQESDRTFEVVALDEDEGTVAIQYFESEVEEMDVDNWYDMDLELAAEPEDWSGPYDDLERDDFGDTDEPMHPENRSNLLEGFEEEGEADYD
ncbi:MAG: hypothetical protein P8Z75_04420 [Gammaproteobacteria bacterium]|jgi:hypothetical protein